MPREIAPLSLLVALCLLAACGEDAGRRDASRDADAAGFADALPDIRTDAALPDAALPDAVIGDAVRDGAADADEGPDTRPDAPQDAVLDVDPDAIPDATPDAALDAALDVRRDASADGDDVPPDAGPPPVERPYDELPVAACGMPAYEVIDPDELGEVVAWEPLPLWDLTADTLNGLLAEAGYDIVTLPYGVRLWRLRYTTQDRGERVEATAIVGVPRGERPDAAPLPIALHLHGTTGFVDECAPSHPDSGLMGPAIPATFAALGYVVVAPDYIGMNGFGAPATVRHAYLVGEQIAFGAWDAVRAARDALAALAEPVATAPRVVPWGGSQGGHAALFAEHYAPYYAPEFEVPGVVALVPPLDLVPIWQYSAPEITASSGLFTISLAALYEWYGRQGSLTEVLTNEEPWFIADNAVATIYPEDRCRIENAPDVSDAAQVFPEASIAAIVAGDWEALSPWSCYYRENSLRTSSVPPLRFTPTLTVFSEEDVLVRPPALHDAFAALCTAGWRLEYLECAGARHTDGAVWSLPEQIAWVAARLDGEPIPEERLCGVRAPVVCELTP